MKLIYECLLWLLSNCEHKPEFGCRWNGPYCKCGLESLQERISLELKKLK